MNIINLIIEDLKEYENNPRHNDGAIDAVANSIKEFGFKVPIIIDKNNVIVAGHTRLKAARKLGLETVPCLIADDLTDDQIKAFRLADNKVSELAEWDFTKLEEELNNIELDMSMFSFDMDSFNTEEKEAEEDNFDVDAALEEEEEPIVKRGEIWRLGDHYLMCGDSTCREDVQKLISIDDKEKEFVGEGKIDLVVTDPPYNIAYEGKAGTIQNDNMKREEFKTFLTEAFTRMYEVMRKGAAFYVWYGAKESVNFETSLNDSNLPVKQQLIWVKSQFTLGRQDYQWRHEPCLYGWKEGAGHYFVDDRTQSTIFEDKPNLKKMNKQELIEYIKTMQESKIATTIIEEDKPINNSMHPTMKPLKLIGRLIKNSSKKNEKILDLFGGSGSTLITCEQLDRKCYTMELDERYASIIIKRYEELTGNEAKRVC